LNEDDAVENNQLAFDVAEREFGIPPVTTGKEMASAQEPDKLSMVMYLSKFYELFRGAPLRPVGKHLKEDLPGLLGPLSSSPSLAAPNTDVIFSGAAWHLLLDFEAKWEWPLVDPGCGHGSGWEVPCY
jgi:hypothetical protein